MDVYLIPASATRYALYCEEPASSPDDEHAEPASWTSRWKAMFRRAVAEGAAETPDGSGDAPERSRLRRFVTRRIAEAVAEQRLLWRLRHITAARLVHPATMSGERALALARAEFAHDHRRHARWLALDGLLAAVTGPALFFVPGPNLVSWYFTFRAIGHFLAMRGARRALSHVTWTVDASSPLAEVARALTLAPDARMAVVDRAAAALGLERLALFVERIADPRHGAGVYSPRP